MHSKNCWKIRGKEPTKQKRNGKFVKVRFPRRLEPNSGTVRFEANETESRAAVELAKTPIHTEAQRVELFLGPGEQLP